MKKIFKLGLIAPVALALMMSSCGSSSDDTSTDGNKEDKTGMISGTITANGSSALLPFAQFLATSFQSSNPDVSIIINGGGSGTGLKDVSSKTVDIGMSDVFADEKLDATSAKSLVDHKVCAIGIGIIVNKDIGIKDISKDNLKKIFDGSITNWKDAGGKDEKIVIINRPSSSGTRALFTKWALDGSKTVDGDSSLQTDDSKALSETVSTTNGAIGYVAFSYFVDKNASFTVLSIDGVEATNDNIYNGKYPVWGYEHMYTNGEAVSPVKEFIEYADDEAMIKQYEAMGYCSISKLSKEAAAQKDPK